MDYHDSSAGIARLAVTKYAATVPEKQGTIFFNPGDSLHPSSVTFHQHLLFTGGPGESGIEFIAALGQALSEDFQGAYDLVSWDPRGVGFHTL